jgi:hypothetical protein
MKKYVLITLLLVLSAKLFAQTAGDEARALRGGRTSLNAEKSILSADEQTFINIDVFIPPDVDSHTGEASGDGHAVHMGDVSHTLASGGLPISYHARNWKILSGGGSLDIIDEYTVRYTAPAQAPKDNTMTISVELIPTGTDLPKVVLLKTLYFDTGENSFAFNVPGSGMNDERYSQSTRGAKVSATNPSTVVAIDPALLARLPAAERERLKAQKAKVDAAIYASGVNLVSLTSNANAIYDSQNNVSVIKFLSLGRSTTHGGHTTIAEGSNLLVITYTGGLTKGVHPFNGSLNSFTFSHGGTRPDSKTCVCSMKGNNDLQHLPCSGTLTITSMDGNFIKGSISTTVWNNKTGHDKIFNRGTVYGVFTIRKAY